MITELLMAEKISLTAWVQLGHSRLACAQRTVRRFVCWLDNKRIKVHKVAQVTKVVAPGKSRWVDPHWFRGNSDFRSGW